MKVILLCFMVFILCLAEDLTENEYSAIIQGVSPTTDSLQLTTNKPVRIHTNHRKQAISPAMSKANAMLNRRKTKFRKPGITKYKHKPAKPPKPYYNKGNIKKGTIVEETCCCSHSMGNSAPRPRNYVNIQTTISKNTRDVNSCWCTQVDDNNGAGTTKPSSGKPSRPTTSKPSSGSSTTSSTTTTTDPNTGTKPNKPETTTSSAPTTTTQGSGTTTSSTTTRRPGGFDGDDDDDDDVVDDDDDDDDEDEDFFDD